MSKTTFKFRLSKLENNKTSDQKIKSNFLAKRE